MIDRLETSIVIPMFNGARYILDALRSVAAQTEAPCEIIVVDDASTDRSSSIVDAWSRTSKIPLRTIRCAVNSGSPSRPMNQGIADARGEIIVVLDQDDLLSPTKIERESRVLRENPHIAFAFSCSATTRDPLRKMQSYEVLERLREIGVARNGFWEIPGDAMLKLLFEHGCFVMGFPGFSFRRSDWRRKGGVDENLRIADHEFLCWLSTQGPVAYLEDIHYQRRLHDHNLSRDRQLVEADFVQCVSRYLSAQQRSISVRQADWINTRNACMGIAYALRQSGRYSEAWNCYQTVCAVWGWRIDVAICMAKLCAHRELSRLQHFYSAVASIARAAYARD